MNNIKNLILFGLIAVMILMYIDCFCSFDCKDNQKKGKQNIQHHIYAIN